MSEMDNEEVQDTQVPLAESETADNDDQKPVFNRRQLTDVINREKQKAFERGKRVTMEQLQQAQQQPAEEQQPPQAQMPPQSMGGMQQMSPEEIRRMIADQMSSQAPKMLQDHMQQMSTQQVAHSFIEKMKAAEARHPGLEAKLNELDWTHLSPIIHLVNDMENPGEIMKELVENPMKMGNILTLAHTQPRLASQAMHNLSNSIKQNMIAQAQEDNSHDPLSPIRPSNVGSDGGSRPSMRDFKSKYRG